MQVFSLNQAIRHHADDLSHALVRSPRCRPDWVGRTVSQWRTGQRRISQWLGEVIKQRRIRCSDGASSTPAIGRLVPSIKTLEPRIVLNATAELSAASGLLVFGDLADDTVRMNLVGNGDAIELTDANGNIIPINGNTGGPTGSETDPLAIADINHGMVTVDLGGGNDLLQIELPDGINLTVIDGDGDDRTELDVRPSGSPSPPTSVLIASETIDLSPSGPFIPFADRDVSFSGGVFVGSSASSGSTQIDLGTGTFQIDGTLTLDGSVHVTGQSGNIDWREATISATVNEVDLIIDLDQNSDSSVEVGVLDDSAGQFVDDFRIVSSTNAAFTGDVTIGGALTVDALESVSLDGAVSAGAIGVAADQVTAIGAVSTQTGSIVLSANDQLWLGDEIDSSSAELSGNITLSAANLNFVDTSINLAGANLLINGASNLEGDIQIDAATGSGVLQGGDVVWVGPIVNGASVQPSRLTISSIGSVGGGEVVFRSDVGGAVEGSPQDLQSLVVDAGEIEIQSVGVDGGPVDLTADRIDVLGPMIRLSDTPAGGDGDITIRFSANDHLAVAGVIDSTSGRIVIDSGAVLSDLSLATLLSTASESSIALYGGDFLLGDIIATSGSVTLGSEGGLGEIGSVEQAIGTSINAPVVTASSGGVLILDSISNQMEEVDLRADGAVVVNDSAGDLAVTIDAGSSVEVKVAGDLLVNQVLTNSGRIEIDARTINDASGDDEVDLIGEQISLNADNGIGSTAALTLAGVSDLEAVTVMGSIRLNVVADRVVTLSDVSSGGGDGEEIIVRHIGSDPLEILDVSNRNGSVSISAETASIDVLQRAGGDALFAGAIGSILLQNLGGDSDITVRGDIRSELGKVEINARRDLIFTPTGSLNSASGAVSLLGGSDPLLFNGAIDLQDGSQIDAGSGTVFMGTQGDVFVSSIRSTNSGDAITIRSTNGSLIDSGDAGIDLVADAGAVRIDVSDGIGDGQALETQIDRLFAQVRQTGSLAINEATALVLTDVVTADGKIEVSAVGTLTAERVQSQNRSQSDGTMHRDIRLVTTGSESDILVGSLVAENVTDVHLISGDDVLRFGADSLLVADDLAVTSWNGFSDQSDSLRLSTNVNDLEFNILGANRGDAQIDETDSVDVASSDRQDDSEVVFTTNGEIRIGAGESIFVSDSLLIDDKTSLRGDVEIIAGGTSGRIGFSAGQSIQLGDLVQMQADQFVVGAVVIESPQVVLGEDFQIETGDGVGVARIFAPRPDENRTDTAFYQWNSVSTSALEQAAFNGATGVLTVDIGNPGERGLSINIDWGAEQARFQQIDSLSGDGSPLQVQHGYSQNDILSSRLNGRGSATDPLQVRFAVRHHESILVFGQSIQQSASETETVAGELISSTDNPLTQEGPNTPILENGRAQFMIPNLTIPQSFIPISDVIPVIEQAAVVVSPEQTFVLIGAGMEVSETVPSSTSAREEYFQIRVLSPDPDGDDSIPPTRLPDDIISGDKLQKLFQSLPDGRYDIQYVLGDGNVRSILSVDLRDGKPILPGDAGDAGTLRLVPVQPELEAVDLDEQKGSSDELQREFPDQSNLGSPVIRIDAAEGMNAESESGTQQPGRLSVAGRLRSRGLQLGQVSSSSSESN